MPTWILSELDKTHLFDKQSSMYSACIHAIEEPIKALLSIICYSPFSTCVHAPFHHVVIQLWSMWNFWKILCTCFFRWRQYTLFMGLWYPHLWHCGQSVSQVIWAVLSTMGTSNSVSVLVFTSDLWRFLFAPLAGRSECTHPSIWYGMFCFLCIPSIMQPSVLVAGSCSHVGEHSFHPEHSLEGSC